MASIKVNAYIVRMACDDYKKAHNERVEAKKKEEEDEYGWIEDTVSGNNASVVARIKDMADVVSDTQYPYVILSYNDFILIGKYMGKYGIN